MLSPKGKYMVNQPDLTRLWEAGTGKPISDVTGSGQVLGFSPDERLVLRQGNGKGGPSLWEIASGCTVRQFARNQLIIRRLLVSPDGRYLILVGPDDQYKDHQVVWDLATGQVVQHVNDANIDDLTFHPLRRCWATVDRTQKITLWDVPSGRELRSWKADSKGVTTMAFSPDGQYLITANSKVSGCTIWEVATGHELRTIAQEQSDIWLISFTLDSSGIIASNDKQTRIWDLTTGAQLPTFNHQSIDLSSSIISRDRRYSILNYGRPPYKLWQIENGREIATFDGANEEIWSFVISHNEKALLTGSRTGKLQMWDVETGKELWAIPTGPDPIRS
ncbi:MAG TPA: WD40 repeat domain-containing protein, partial [Acidobacteriota bacterium]|nr:WD40 repeat domain-containing protein [Acidobacteriota bacterium]